MTDVGIFCDESDIIMKRMERRCTIPLIDSLNNELPCHRSHKEYGRRALRTLLNRLRLRRAASAEISAPDPIYKVAYLGNVLTGWAKGNSLMSELLPHARVCNLHTYIHKTRSYINNTSLVICLIFKFL